MGCFYNQVDVLLMEVGMRLKRNNYATFQEIRTKTITVQASNNRGDSKKAKLFITLKRGPDFFENMKKFNEIREENEKTANKLQQESDKEKTQWAKLKKMPYELVSGIDYSWSKLSQQSWTVASLYWLQ